MPSPHPLSLHVETKTQSTVVGVGCLPLPSSHHASGASRPSSRSSLRPSVRPACLPHMPRCGSRRLIISSARLSLGGLLPHHRLAHRLAPCLVSPGSPPHRQAKRGETKTRSAAGGHRRCADGGGCLLASDGCWLRVVIDGGWRLAWLLACLGAMDGAARSFLDRSSFPIIGSSNRLGPGSFHHLIISSHRLGGTFFPFSPDPLPPALLGLFALACSHVPGRGMRGLRHGLRRRAWRLLACVLGSRAALSLLLVRSLLHALRRSCRSFLPGASWGVLWAFLTAILSALAFLKTCP